MDTSKLVDTLQATLGETLPTVLGALAILVVGWVIARDHSWGSAEIFGIPQCESAITFEHWGGD